MSKTNSDVHLSSDEESIPLTNSKKCVSTTSKPTAIKNAAAVVPDPDSESSDSESETPVAPKKAKSRKEKLSHTIKKAAVSKPSTPAKRVAVVSPDEPSAKKVRSPGLFQRLWTEEDEITVLKQMLKYKDEKGVYALKDTKDFHAFVKDALLVDFDFDCKQLVGKARKLKIKYKNSSGKKNLTPHEEKLKKLSKLIWGANSDTNSVKKAAAVSICDVKDSSPIVEKEQVDAEDGAQDGAEDAAEDAAEDGAENGAEDGAEDAAAENDAAENYAGDDVKDHEAVDDKNETNNVCKTKKEWKFIGKKSIAMGLDANTVNAGLEGCSDAVKVEIEEEWEQYHLEAAALFQKQLNLVIKESNCIRKGLKK